MALWYTCCSVCSATDWPIGTMQSVHITFFDLFRSLEPRPSSPKKLILVIWM